MPLRINGYASGMDIDKMVSDLMKAERIPYNKVKQKRDMLGFKMNVYRDVNAKLMTFRESLKDLRLSSQLSGSKFSSSDTSKVSVTGNASNPQSHTIEVESLASGARKSSAASVSNIGLEGSVLTSPISITAGVNDELLLDVNGVTKKIKVNAGTYTADQMQQELQQRINDSFGPNKIKVNLANNKLSLDALGSQSTPPAISIKKSNGLIDDLGFKDKQSSKINLNSPISEIADKFGINLVVPPDGMDHSFTINGYSITYTNKDSLQSIMAKVNQSNAGVNMSYDGVADRFTLTTKGMGATATIDAQSVSGNFLDAIGIDQSVVTGSNAKVKIDGVESERDSNVFSVDGVTYTLNGVTSTPVTIGAERNTDELVDKIKNFVKSYNEVVELVSGKLSEKKDKNYQPLTDEDKKSMNEKDIQLWEDKTKIGILRSDPILAKLNREMRSVLTSAVGNVSEEYNALYKIGLTTKSFTGGKMNPAEAGKIELDESKLRNALEKDTDAVVNLFTRYSDTGVNGVAQQLYDKMGTAITELSKKAGRSGGGLLDASIELGKQYSRLQTDVFDWDKRLEKKETQYYKQFAAMEKAMQKSNSTMSFLMQQFNSNG